MKINLQNNLSFQKTLVAKTKFKNNTKSNKPQSCKIYVLDDIEDMYYISKLAGKTEWKNANFLFSFRKDLASCISPFTRNAVYVMEMGEKNECIALAEVNQESSDLKVVLLETSPKYKKSLKSNKNNKREISYIGETFLAFFAKLAKKNNIDEINLTSVPSAIRFYVDKCGFSPCEKGDIRVFLPKFKYDELIKQNKKHTGGKINFNC